MDNALNLCSIPSWSHYRYNSVPWIFHTILVNGKLPMALSIHEVTDSTLLLNLITLLYCCSNPKDIISIWQRNTKLNNSKEVNQGYFLLAKAQQKLNILIYRILIVLLVFLLDVTGVYIHENCVCHGFQVTSFMWNFLVAWDFSYHFLKSYVESLLEFH